MPRPETMRIASVERAAMPSTPQEMKARLIARYIDRHVIALHEDAGEDYEKYVREQLKSVSPREKADMLYDKVLAFHTGRQTKTEEPAEVNGELAKLNRELGLQTISQIKVLFEDERVKAFLPQIYGEARVDASKYRLSELGKKWEQLRREIREKEAKWQKLERALNLQQIDRRHVSAARTEKSFIGNSLISLKKQMNEIEFLENFPKTRENTDIAALLQFERLMEYRHQLDRGFVWHDSVRLLHEEMVNQQQNGVWPFLEGESGTGKSRLADASALELTGCLPTRVACAPELGREDLIEREAIDPVTKGSYKEYGPLMEAYTGYKDSRETQPTYKTGRHVRLDEALRMKPTCSAYAILKEIGQLRPGDFLNGKKVLPGASITWTTNPVGERYHGRYPLDPAMDRHVRKIHVPFLEMTPLHPEVYEHLLISLMDENHHVAVAKEELMPAYEKVEIPEDTRVMLPDQSVIVAEDRIIEDATDLKHGALWRFANAIARLQECFEYGNTQTNEYPPTLLRYNDRTMEVTTDDSGVPLTLFSTTKTLGELESWMVGFGSRMEKLTEEYHTKTLTEWLDLKIKSFAQGKGEDKEKIEAIFRHFGFLSGHVSDLSKANPLTPKEIGYLSPRVPRPLYIEKPKETVKEIGKELSKELKEYTTTQVLLESEKRVLMIDCEYAYQDGEKKVVVPLGKKTRIYAKDKKSFKDYMYAGVVEAKEGTKPEETQFYGQPLLRSVNEAIFRITDAKEIDLGIYMYEAEDLIRRVMEELPERMKDHWAFECENNPQNNPNNVACPV